MTVEAILLGTAQDGGVPQAGCDCPHCRRAWEDPALHRSPACLGLVDRAAGKSWLIDATPDFPRQLHALREAAPECPLSGIALTHAHVGHYAGLIHLGREVMGVRAMPVHATARVARFLRDNAPWSQLIALGNVALKLLVPGEAARLSSNLNLTPLIVPHRDEFADTVAFVINGPARALLYCPDIDVWDGWRHDLRDLMSGVDVALLDATFFSADELAGREMAEVPHPPVTDTLARLGDVRAEVCLIHLNHTNPLLAAGPARDWAAARGARVGGFGDRWIL